MPYQYSVMERERLEAAVRQSSSDTLATEASSTGNWVPLYQELSTIMSEHIIAQNVTGSDLKDMKDFKLWLDVEWVDWFNKKRLHSTVILPIIRHLSNRIKLRGLVSVLA